MSLLEKWLRSKILVGLRQVSASEHVRISQVLLQQKTQNDISIYNVRVRTCAYQEVRNIRFSENLACFVLLKHPF